VILPLVFPDEFQDQLVPNLRVAPITVFKTVAFVHSAIPPLGMDSGLAVALTANTKTRVWLVTGIG
jgi:hypothetical protein